MLVVRKGFSCSTWCLPDSLLAGTRSWGRDSDQMDSYLYPPYGGQKSWTSGFGKYQSQIHLDILVHTIICHTKEFLTLNVGLKAQL